MNFYMSVRLKHNANQGIERIYHLKFPLKSFASHLPPPRVITILTFIVIDQFCLLSSCRQQIKGYILICVLLLSFTYSVIFIHVVACIHSCSFLTAEIFPCVNIPHGVYSFPWGWTGDGGFQVWAMMSKSATFLYMTVDIFAQFFQVCI